MTVAVCTALLVIGWFTVRRIPSAPTRYVLWAASMSMYAGWVGYLILRTSSGGGRRGLVQHSMLMAAFGVGALLASTQSRRRRGSKRNAPQIDVSPRSGIIVLGGLTMLAAFHFARIGIPILSPEVDILRWNFRGSGLGGLPGRAYSLGLPLFMIYAIVAANRCRPKHRVGWRQLRLASIAIVVVTRVIGGFKGDLLETVIMIVLAGLLSGADVPKLPAALRRRISVGIVLALAAAIAISTQYYATQYHRQNSGMSIGEQFVERVTVKVVDSGSALIGYADAGDRPIDGLAVLNDFDVYLGGSFGLWDVSDQYLTSQHLSGRMNQRDITFGKELSFQYFVVPVTPGVAAIAYFDFGWLGVVVVGVLLGALCGLLARRALTSPATLPTFWGVVAVDGLRQYVQKGDLAYAVTNYTLVAGGLVVGLLVLDGIIRPRLLAHHRVTPAFQANPGALAALDAILARAVPAPRPKPAVLTVVRGRRSPAATTAPGRRGKLLVADGRHRPNRKEIARRERQERKRHRSGKRAKAGTSKSERGDDEQTASPIHDARRARPGCRTARRIALHATDSATRTLNPASAGSTVQTIAPAAPNARERFSSPPAVTTAAHPAVTPAESATNRQPSRRSTDRWSR